MKSPRNSRLRTSVLEIRRHDDAYSFSLRRPGKPLMGPTLQVWRVKVAPDIVSALSQTIRDAVDAANAIPCPPGAAHNPFVEAGTNLYRQFLPDGDLADLRKQLRKLNNPLLITTDIPGICWELLYDDQAQSFLCLKHSVGRCLITRAVPSAQPRGERAWRCLLIASSTPGKRRAAVPETVAEAASLRDGLARNVKHIDFLDGPNASLEGVLGALGRHEYDIIHYAGHTEFDRQSQQYGLVLHDGKYFLASTIKRAVRGNPIVFLNGCWTGVAKGTASSEGSVEGLTDAFLEAGAQLVVGSQFEAPDAGARAFAEKFYETVLEGNSVGEAMRLARLHVKANHAHAATWACFVMYGDPSLRLNLQDDLLTRLLASIKLRRSDFEEPGLRVVEQALDYAGKSYVVATGEIFAALVDSESGWLRNRLIKQRVPVKELAEAFKSGLKKINEPSRGTTRRSKQIEPSFSENAERMMQAAQAEAKTSDRLISEQQLINAFVKHQGGSTGKILKPLGVDIARLRNDADDDDDDDEREIEAWECPALKAARALAEGSAHTLVETRHLFFGLLQNKQGSLPRALRRFNISIDLTPALASQTRDSQEADAPAPTPTALKYSSNVAAIVRIAQSLAKAAGNQPFTDDDLLAAFVQHGGGSTGKELLKNGIVLEAITSNLFLDSGGLDPSRVAVELLKVIERGNEFREQKGHGALSRRHLLYALLATEGTIFSKCLSQQGQNAVNLAELFYAEVPAGRPTNARATVARTVFAPTVLTILCAAEAEATKRQQHQISEALFESTFLKYVGSEAQKFLAKQGISLSKLMSCLEGNK